MPIHAVPKDAGTTFRMVTDHSAGKFSLNSMIDRSQVSPTALDNMRHVGDHLLWFRRHHPDKRLSLWKADVSEAYRLLPMHPHWQIKQIVTIHNRQHVDWRNCFGNRLSGDIWVAFMSLVIWIAIHVHGINNVIGAYVDDSFGFDCIDDLTLYEPYNRLMMSSQVRLLSLWDQLGIPHKEKKQVFGSPLPIIGLSVDANKMTITLPESSKANLIEELERWTSHSKQKICRRKWQALAGWLNWAFNPYPLLRPCLNRVYPKIEGRESPFTKIWMNKGVRYDLHWALEHIRTLPGTRLIRSSAWDPYVDADWTIYTDAHMGGMGFWYPDLAEGFYSPVPPEAPVPLIYYNKALCVVSALAHAASHALPGSRIAIFTDNTNTVNILSSLHCVPYINHLLLFFADILIKADIDVRVMHVPGEQNTVADAISQQWISEILRIVPNYVQHNFQPPRFTLGAMEK